MTPEGSGWEPRSRTTTGTLLLLSTGAGLYIGDLEIAQTAFFGLIAFVVFFAARRFPKRRDTPPPEFLLIGFGLLHAMVGAILILYPIAGWVQLGERVVQQGMLLPLVMGIGSYLWPRLSGNIDERTDGNEATFPMTTPVRGIPVRH